MPLGRLRHAFRPLSIVLTDPSGIIMGTVHLLLAIVLLTDNLDARPFYDDADENNAKFLEAILYGET